MLAEHSSKGLLQSGSTNKAALRSFEEHSREALAKTLEEVAKLIEHRGPKWRAAMAGIEEALNDHLARARAHLQPTISLADRAATGSVSKAVDERLAGTAARLKDQLSEFCDGWTAPAPKLWKDRHPLAFQVLLLIIGAAVALGLSYATGLLHLT
jgi:hypothetical protein